MVIPIFSTHHSIGESILTTEKESKVERNKPASVLAIAKQHEDKQVVVADSDISGYWKLYKNSKALDLQLIYGIKIAVCDDLSDKSPESVKTESNVIIFLKNSQAYYDVIPLYSLSSTEGMLKHRRTDWKTLKRLWTKNLELCVPFYSSFIARNLTVYEHSSLPDFTGLEPTFLIQNQGLPFDDMIDTMTKRYCTLNSFPMMEAHQIYYYLDEDVMSHQTLLCITQRSGYKQRSWDKPELPHYCSDRFSYESYLRRIGKSI